MNRRRFFAATIAAVAATKAKPKAERPKQTRRATSVRKVGNVTWTTWEIK